jgi:hypothetical protein
MGMKRMLVLVSTLIVAAGIAMAAGNEFKDKVPPADPMNPGGVNKPVNQMVDVEKMKETGTWVNPAGKEIDNQGMVQSGKAQPPEAPGTTSNEIPVPAPDPASATPTQIQAPEAPGTTQNVIPSPDPMTTPKIVVQEKTQQAVPVQRKSDSQESWKNVKPPKDGARR